MDVAYKTEYEFFNEDTKEATENQISLAMEEHRFIMNLNS